MSQVVTGAPGIYFKQQEEKRTVDTIAMDVCGFIGVSPRGPAREADLPEGWVPDRPFVGLGFATRRSVAVAVESFDEYRRLFGGFEGPGRLPYAVASFFENGGRRAHVVRIVHDYGKDPSGREKEENFIGVAKGNITGSKANTGEILLRARNEGTWGNSLRAALGYSAMPLNFESTTSQEVILGIYEPVSLGDLLRITLRSGKAVFRFITKVRKEISTDGSAAKKSAAFAYPLVDLPESMEIIQGELLIEDGAGYREIHEKLGLSSMHPRWMGTVLCYESELVLPDESWINGELLPDDVDDLPSVDSLETIPLPQFREGADRYRQIVPDDFFDEKWTADSEKPGDGIHAAVLLSDLSAMVVPDLYSPEPLEPVGSVSNPEPLAGPDFAPCLDTFSHEEEQEVQVQELEGLSLDPLIPGELAEIVSLQQQLVKTAGETGGFVALLDVPPGLTVKQVKAWRAMFDSSFSAAYHPWLKVARGDDKREGLILLNPSAFAAGIIARQEHLYGVPHGPANAWAVGAMDMKEQVSPAEHDGLHPLGINVFLKERDGIRLSAARTLSKDPLVRQLSVRRLIMMIRRTLERETHWMVFEPNGPALWAKVTHMLKTYLRQLFRMGAFKGAVEEEAFFVRCDGVFNPSHITDAGKMVAQIGLAPAEPIEFIVLNLAREGDGTLVVTE